MDHRQMARRVTARQRHQRRVIGVLLGLSLLADSALAEPALLASVLPGSRSVAVGEPATFFATLLNAGSSQALGCTLAPRNALPAAFSFQQTDPASNALIGTADAAVDLAAGQAASFLIAVTPAQSLAATTVELDFACANSAPAPTVPGVNTLLLAASSSPTADLVALAAVVEGNGIVSANPAAAFSVASVNLGTSAEITARAQLTAPDLPVALAVCQTDPDSGACVNPSVPAASAAVVVPSGATPTFGVFVSTSGDVPFDPAAHRVAVQFTDAEGELRGSTSVALRTQAPASDPVTGTVLLAPQGDINSPQGGTLGSVTAPLSAQAFAHQFTAPAGRTAAPPDTIAYVRPGTNSVSLRTVRSDGSQDRRVLTLPTPSAYVGDLVWRPDGTEIAFLSDFEVGVWSSDIYAATVDGSNLRRLTSVPRPIAYPNYPQGRAVLNVRHPDAIGSVTVAYIEGAQQAFGWLASAVQLRDLDFPLADFGSGIAQEAVVNSSGLCYFDAAANVDVVADETISIPQTLPPTTLSNDFACPLHLSPQWDANGELFYLRRTASEAEILFNLRFALVRGPTDNLPLRSAGRVLANYDEDGELVEGSRPELMYIRLHPDAATGEFLLLSQVGSPINSSQPDKVFVGSFNAPQRQQLQRLTVCPDQFGCDLADLQYLPDGAQFVYTSQVTALNDQTTRSRLWRFSVVDGVVQQSVLHELASGNFGRLAVSPDGRRVLVERTGVEFDATTDLWLYDLDSGALTLFLENARQPAWR